MEVALDLGGLESIGNGVVSGLGVLVGIEEQSITLGWEDVGDPALREGKFSIRKS